MRKILLDFNMARTPEQVQEYLAQKFGFPDYYGKNLDALYDMLTELAENTCVGIFESNTECQNEGYLRNVKQVFWDAEKENPHLLVLSSRLEENYER